MADHSAEIARIRTVLNTGAAEVVVDGRRTRFDVASTTAAFDTHCATALPPMTLREWLERQPDVFVPRRD